MWWVIFSDLPESQKSGWRESFLRYALSFLKDGFRHVLAVGMFDGCTIVYNPHSGGTDIYPTTSESLNELLDGLPNKTMVKVDQVRGRVMFPVEFTCATSIARLVGINRPLLTPWGLHKAIFKRGLAGMGGMFSTPKTDTSVAEAQIAADKEATADAEASNAAKLAAAKTTGRGALMAFEGNLEGVPRTKLGAGTQ